MTRGSCARTGQGTISELEPPLPPSKRRKSTLLVVPSSNARLRLRHSLSQHRRLVEGVTLKGSRRGANNLQAGHSTSLRLKKPHAGS